MCGASVRGVDAGVMMRGLCAGAYGAACLGIIVCCLVTACCAACKARASRVAVGLGACTRGSTWGHLCRGSLPGVSTGHLIVGAIVAGAIACRGGLCPGQFCMESCCAVPGRGVFRAAYPRGLWSSAEQV